MSDQQSASTHDEPEFTQSIAAIGICTAGAPEWLLDRQQRRDPVVNFAHEEAYAKPGSPRARAAKSALSCVRHHDQLDSLRCELQAAPDRFLADRAAAGDELRSRQATLSEAKATSGCAAEKHQHAKLKVTELDAKLLHARQQAEQRRDAAVRTLSDVIASENEDATAKAAAAVAKARKEVEAATAAQLVGPDAEVLSAHRQHCAATEVASIAAADRLNDAQAALKAAEERVVRLEIDCALVNACDRIVASLFAICAVGNQASTAELTVPESDERRVPLIGGGLHSLLRILYAPNYAALSVDLAALSDGNEPVENQPEYYDEAATRRANQNGVKFHPEIPPRPGERGVSVTYSDPDMNEREQRVRRVHA